MHARRMQKLGMLHLPPLDELGERATGLTAIVTGPTRWAWRHLLGASYGMACHACTLHWAGCGTTMQLGSKRAG